MNKKSKLHLFDILWFMITFDILSILICILVSATSYIVVSLLVGLGATILSLIYEIVVSGNITIGDI